MRGSGAIDQTTRPPRWGVVAPATAGHDARMSRLPFWLSAAQAVYFSVTGVWPIVHIHSFMAVTGPKRDLWLVRTVGALITAVAVPIGLAAWRVRGGGAVPPEVVVLAAGSAAVLGA